MAILCFRVQADYDKVIKLREEITKLKNELKNMDSTQSRAAFNALNEQLGKNTREMNNLIEEAAKAGAVIEGDFRKKIFDASQTVNGFTEKIIVQKAVVKDTEADVKRLGEAYRIALKRNPFSANSKLADYTSACKALDEERAALFGLTQQQAEARLSVKKLRDEYELYKKDAGEVVNVNNGISLSLGKALGVIGGIAALKRLVSEIIRVRGEFQSMQTAIETMVGKDMAGQLIPQIKELAKISPLTMSDMVGAEKMMLGFSIQAEDTIKYLKALSDISMGESGKFNSLTLAFSQMSAAGKLMGQDLNQMINAGFNPLQIIAEKTGKSIATLKNEMSKGAVSAEMVQQAFIDATSAGGKFYGMSENASKTINGQISMMQDAWDNALNEIGKSSEGFIMSGIQATTSLIQNYETIGKVLVGMIATYGVYKTALIINITLTRGWATAARADAVARGIQTIATKAQTVAQLALNSAMRANPYVLAATLIAGVISTMWALHDSTKSAKKALEEFNHAQDKLNQDEEDGKRHLENLIQIMNDENEAYIRRVGAMNAIRDEYPDLFKKYIDEKGHIKNLTGLWKEYNEQVAKSRNEADIQATITTKSQIENLEQELKRPHQTGSALTSYDSIREARIRKKLDVLRNKLKLEEQKVREDLLNQWHIDLINQSDKQIEAELNESKRILEARKDLPNFNLPITLGTLPGVASDAEIKKRISILETEQKSRQKEGTNYEQDLVKAKKEWEDAKKALAAIEKDKDKFTTKQYEEAKKRKESTEKAYKDLGGVTGSALTKQESEAEKQKKKQQKLAEDLLSLDRKNQQDKINLLKEGTEKKLKQIELDYQKEIDAYNKAKAKYGETDEVKQMKTNADDKREKSIANVTKEQLKAEAEAMRNYLKEYGTFQQQKLAIAEEYAEKIKKAQEENGVYSAQVKLLEKERDVAIQNKETEAIKANIDWVTVFSEFGGMFNDMIKPALEEAKKYMQTDKFKNSDQASQKVLIDAIHQMEKSLGGTGGLNFKKLGQEVQIYQNSLRNLNTAKEEEASAVDKLKKAQEDYEKALKNGGKTEKQVALDALTTARKNADVASANVKSQTDIANGNQQALTNTAINLKANMDDVTEGLSKLASGGIKSAYDGLIQAGKGMGGSMEKIAKKLEDVPIIGWIVSIIDVFKDGLSDLIGGLLDAIFNAISGILSDILSGDLLVTIGKSLRDGIGNILNSISFGGFTTLTHKISGSNAKEVREAIDRLTSRNETLGKSIDRLTDVMDKTAGSKSISAYEQAYNYQQEQNRNTLQIAQAQAGYRNSHHSWQYYMGWTNEQIQWARKNVDKNFSGTDSLWGLTPEQMKMLLSNADIYEQINGAGKGGYGNRVMERLETYADNAGKLDELTDKINESLMQVSFDSLRDSFLNSLMDMDKDAQSFSEDFSEYMQRALLNFSMGEMFDEDLKNWYDNLAELMKAQNGKLTEYQLNAARKDYDDLVQDAINERDQIAAITGYSGDGSKSQQSATKRGVETITQDQAGELTGRITDVQGTTRDIKAQVIQQTETLSILSLKAGALLNTNNNIRNIADETRTILANSYLELRQISDNTGAIITPIKEMNDKLEKIQRNTENL